MKNPLTLLSVLTFAASVHAAVTIDYVTVGDAGNAADSTGYGAVAYDFQIGKYEVTNAQYAEFLTNVAATDSFGLFNASMGSDARGGITRSGVSGSFTYSVKANMGDKPVNYVSHLDAQRFANWMHNGQGSGSTETGAYTVGNLAIRTSGATVWLPSENEWYKAAYYQPAGAGGDTDNYWDFATQSNDIPTVGTVDANGNITNDGANVANYANGAIWNSQTGNLTTVGSAGASSDSYYGAYDLGGNVSEWNEAIISTSRGVRGGSWSGSESGLRASGRFGGTPTFEGNSLGSVSQVLSRNLHA
jgi:formylglycine-generating enzyme